MSLSCGCDDWGDDADWYWNGSEFRPLELKRGTRCKACKTLIKPGVVCLALDRFRGPKTDFEERIYGEDVEITLASWYLCERCGDIYSSLTELGFCVDPTESMDSQLAEYYRDYAKPPAPGFTLNLSSPKPV